MPTTSSSRCSPAGFAAALTGGGLRCESTTTAPAKIATASNAAAAATTEPNEGLHLGRSWRSGAGVRRHGELQGTRRGRFAGNHRVGGPQPLHHVVHLATSNNPARLVGERYGQSSTRAVQPNRKRRAGTPDHDCCFGDRQPLPGDQQQRLTVALTQQANAAASNPVAGRRDGRGGGARLELPDQRGISPRPAVDMEDHTPRTAEQPGQLRTFGDHVDPPPGDREHLAYDVVRRR